MLVVPPRDNFIVVDEENRPGPDFLAHAVFAPHSRPHDLADSRDFQTDEPDGRVADNQQKLHPERSMSEQSKENLDDSEFRSPQRRTVGIAKVRVSDQFPAQHAAGRDIAFNDIHAEHLGEGNLEKRSAQRNGRMKRPFPTQFGSAGPQACGCGSSPASGSGRGRGLPAGGTAEVRGVVGSSTDSRFGFLPLSRSMISSPVRVSYSSRPFAKASRSARFSVRILVAWL